LRASPLTEYIRPAAVKNIWAAFEAGRTSWSRPWSLYVLGKWVAGVLK
jgi:hypothetical protein